jgi:hypothetical protein
MSKSVILEIPEAEVANLETALDQLLSALRRLDDEHQARWEEVDRLKAETHLMMEQIRAALTVDRRSAQAMMSRKWTDTP